MIVGRVQNCDYGEGSNEKNVIGGGSKIVIMGVLSEEKL